MGDIISLYQKHKPYPQQVTDYIQKQYLSLQKQRISFLTYSVPPVIIFVSSALLYKKSTMMKFNINTFNRSNKQLFLKGLAIFVGSHVFYEAYLWNKLLAKVYLIQREKTIYE